MSTSVDASMGALADAKDGKSNRLAESLTNLVSTTVAPSFARPYRYKQKEAAALKPAGADEKDWDKAYASADSRIYHQNKKDAKKSALARGNGETHKLALQIYAEREERKSRDAEEKEKKKKKKKGEREEEQEAQNQLTNLHAASTPSPPIIANANAIRAAQKDDSLSHPLPTSTTSTPSTITASTSTAPIAAMDLSFIKEPTSKGNKMRKVESKSPEVTPEPLGETSSVSISEKGKGRSRVGNKHLQQGTSRDLIIQQPQAYFGRQDPSNPQPFGFSDEAVPDFDPKHPFRGKDSLPTARQEFNELSSTFKTMTMDAQDQYDNAQSLEVNSRDTNDFEPDEKPESGPLKRYAGFEPFVRGSPLSPASSRSHTPLPKEATKSSKKKINRGPKKKAATAKKKAAAKEVKVKDEKGKGKSAEPDQEEEEEEDASEGASSNDGGEYCICRGPDDHRPMIACDNCDEWYHCSCVGVKDYDVLLIDKYVCEKCRIPEIHFTTYKPMCRLPGCRKPANTTITPASKYCTPEHRAQFWDEMVARAADGPGPSHGGAITKGELKAMLDHTEGDVKAFHALGKKPSLPTAPEAIDWTAILTSEEKGRLCTISAEKIILNTRSTGFKDKEKVVRMAMDRLKKVTEARKELTGICGWDARFAMNEEEFEIWRNSEVGMKVFETHTLDNTFCEKKNCVRHRAWVKVTLSECRMEDNLVHKQLGKLRAEEHAIKDRAGTRAATQL